MTHIGVDVTDENSIVTAIDQITADNGRVDILVNCAGNGISGAVEFTELKDAKTQFEVSNMGGA